MQSRWSDSEAQDFVRATPRKGVNADLALRTYTTRLLGTDPQAGAAWRRQHLRQDQGEGQLGDDVEVICIKGSRLGHGQYRARRACPPCGCAPLRRLRTLDKLSDEDMVNFQRINLLDSPRPIPSVETLLHAFLPHKFIDHTHSTAVLALTDQPDGEALAREVYGDARRLCALHHSRLRAGQVGRRCVRQEPERRRPGAAAARHLHRRRRRRDRPTSR